MDELLEAFDEAATSYYLGGLRLSEVEGGRFCEAAFRILENVTTGNFTPLGKSLKSDRLIAQLAALPNGSFPDAVRLHIPRALRVIYDVRNNRDAAHLGDGIDPNLQDATLVLEAAKWVLAELVRLYHNVSADVARQLIESIVIRKAPLIQDFNGYLKVLTPALTASDHCLVLLYHRGAEGATYAELNEWARPKMRSNLRRTLARLVEDKAFLHTDGVKYFVTRTGQNSVEVRRLFGTD